MRMKKSLQYTLLLFSLAVGGGAWAQMDGQGVEDDRRLLESMLSSYGRPGLDPYYSFRFSEGNRDRLTYYFAVGSQQYYYEVSLSNIQAVDYIDSEAVYEAVADWHTDLLGDSYRESPAIALTLRSPVTLRQLKGSVDVDGHPIGAVDVVPVFVGGYGTFRWFERLMSRIDNRMKALFSRYNQSPATVQAEDYIPLPLGKDVAADAMLALAKYPVTVAHVTGCAPMQIELFEDVPPVCLCCKCRNIKTLTNFFGIQVLAD